jgi:hypothetical protein
LAVFLNGCALQPTLVNSFQRDEIYLRASARFGSTVLWKPDAAPENSPAARFAPLIVEEVFPGVGAAAPSDSFLPVAAEVTKITINGRACDQFTFTWKYPSHTPAAKALSTQGVRITLDSSGKPVIWEALADTSGAQIIFVSQSLEAAARAAFGPPLSGRRFSIERSLAQAPNTVVARVIEDSPTPMGPVVYLRAGTHDVSTLICRCMPSQAETLQVQRNYPMTTGPTGFKPSRLRQQLRLPPLF